MLEKFGLLLSHMHKITLARLGTRKLKKMPVPSKHCAATLETQMISYDDVVLVQFMS